jgi:hypothetical protein
MNCLLQTIWYTLKHWLDGGTAIVEGHTYVEHEKIDAWVVMSKCEDCGHESWNWMRKDDSHSLEYLKSITTSEGKKV